MQVDAVIRGVSMQVYTVIRGVFMHALDINAYSIYN